MVKIVSPLPLTRALHPKAKTNEKKKATRLADSVAQSGQLKAGAAKETYRPALDLEMPRYQSTTSILASAAKVGGPKTEPFILLRAWDWLFDHTIGYIIALIVREKAAAPKQADATAIDIPALAKKIVAERGGEILSVLYWYQKLHPEGDLAAYSTQKIAPHLGMRDGAALTDQVFTALEGNRLGVIQAYAKRLGGPWVERAAKFSATDASNLMLLYLMEGTQTQLLSALSPAQIDLLLDASSRSVADADADITALAETASAIQQMDPRERSELDALTQKLPKDPPAMRAALFAVVASEHFALNSTIDTERRAAWQRIRQAATDVLSVPKEMLANSTQSAFIGALGLSKQQTITLKGPKGAKIAVDVYAYPGTDAATTKRAIGLIEKTLKKYSPEVLAAMTSGDGGHLSFRLVPRTAMADLTTTPDKSGEVGLYEQLDQSIALNSDYLAGASDDDVIYAVEHELGHAFSDGIVPNDADGPKNVIDFSAPGLQRHFEDASAAVQTAVSEKDVDQASGKDLEALATDAGATSYYEGTTNTDEFLAGALAKWPDPKTRGILKQRDPAMAAVVDQSMKLVAAGRTKEAAAVIADGPAPSATLEKMVATGQAFTLSDAQYFTDLFEIYTDAFIGWQPPTDNVARLRMTQLSTERESAVQLVQILNRQIQGMPKGKERTALQAIHDELAATVLDMTKLSLAQRAPVAKPKPAENVEDVSE